MSARARLLCLAALLLGSCTPPLTADDALPFQDCVQDSDCTFDSLDCNTSCGGANIAVNAAKQESFDQMKGCWPPSTSLDDCAFNPSIFSCSTPVCSAGRCALANNGCQGEFTAGSAGGSGFTDCENGTCSIGATGGTTAGSTFGTGTGTVGGGSGSGGFNSGSTGTGSPDGGFP